MRVLFVGLGGAGQRHLRNLCTLVPAAERELHAYRVLGRTGVITESLDLDAHRPLERTFGITAHHNLEEALRWRPDAAIIANPTGLHVAVATQLAEIGCHLLIEKPLSDSMDGVADLRAAVRGNRVRALVGYQMRFHPGLQTLERLLREQAIGRVISVQVEAGSYLPSWHRYEDHRTLYAARRELGGGVVLTESHELDYLAWFFGVPHQVTARGTTASSFGYDVEDTADALLDYEGPMGSFVANVHLSMVQQPPSRSCVISGETGQLRWDGASGGVRHFHARTGEWTEHSFPKFQRNDMFLAEMQHFLDCVRGAAEPLVSLEDGVAGLQVALAVKKSISRGSTERVSA